MDWMEILGYTIHAANVVYLLSYLVRDILWLRVLTIVAASTLIPYFVVHDLTAPIAWNLLFLVINVKEVVRLLLERRPVRFDERQERLYHLAFRALSPREFVKLLGLGRWESVPAGEEIVEADAELDELRVIYDGEAEVVVGDAPVATLGQGAFVGEMAYITGGKTSAAVRTASPIQCLTWDKAALDAFLADNSKIRSALQLVVGNDLAAKLRRAA